MILDDWQALVLDVGMGERLDGSWAASDVDVIASRQNGKNGTVEARELYGAVVLGESIIHTSHLFKTSRESYNRLLGLIEANPDVRERLVWQVASPASGYEMRFRGGGRVQFIARSRTSGRGLTGDLLVFDEAQDLDDDAVGALLPVISSRPNPQSWYLGSAPGPLSTVWHRRRKKGRSGGSDRSAYFEFSADPDCDLDDREAWAQSNPGLGLRLSEETIEAERLALSDEMFARERLSVSPDVAVGESGIPAEHWKACGDPSAAPTDPVTFALDASPNLASAAIVVCGGAVEVVEHRPGASWAVARLAELWAGNHGNVVGLDPSGPAGALIPDLEAAGFEIRSQANPRGNLVLLNGRESVQACGAFLAGVLDHSLVHRDEQALNQAVIGAVRSQVGDAWKWSRKNSTMDIAPLVAATVARYLWSTVTVESIYEERGLIEL